MDEAIRSWDNSKPPWAEKQRLSKKMISFLPENLQDLDMGAFNDVEQAAIAELRAARELKDLKDAEIAREREEEKNFTRAKSAGETMECGCCFDEFPLNRMVHCNGDTVHWFCKNCMKTQAETNIGLSKYELTCMSMDGCEAGFSLDQTKLFLNKKLRVALERLEQEASLRMAGIENLESCPFCPYAAEYPPIDVDKEFTCVNPGCEKVSCRLCHKETHIPKTCAEAAVDHGLDARHALEEAMSEALIRRCNNCGNPYLKLNGCNKIYCTKCGKMQCYVCRQTIVDYKHFDDASRGGKNGQCPLFDKTEERHEQEVQRAEEEARQKMLQDNSNITEDALKINISDQVLHDDAKRRRKTQTHGDPAIAEEARNMNNRLLDIRRVAWEQMRHAPAQPVGGPQFVGQDLLPHIMQGNRAARNIPLLPIAPIPAPMPAGIPVGLPMGGYPQQPGAFRGAPVIPPAMNNPFAGMALPQPGAPPLPIPPGGITLDEARVHLLHRFMRNGIPRPPPAERPNPVHLPRHEPQDRGKRNINRRH
ncbi:hypothetical protein F5Y11DRAFT_195727 [Daldinia sp. FL1419]|nr:hypothetical protein F5Y11DRAFT_195727 [Daldinia sp. FL1419]